MHYFPRSCAAFVLLTPLACGAFDTSRIEDTEVRECADRALYRAKAKGKDTVVFSADLHPGT